MRLYNVYYLCKVSIDGIKGLDYRKNEYQNGQSDITVLGWQKAVQSYEVVSEIDFLKEEVKVLLAAIPTYAQNNDDPNVSIATYNAVRSWNYQLLTKMQVIIDMYESQETGEIQAGIDIKVPKCDSFKEYIQYLKDLDFVFSQCPLISQSSEEIVFNTVDVAPMWLSFFIKAEKGKNYILSTLAKMTEVAMKVKANWVVVKQQEDILKRLQQSNEIGEEVIEAYKKVKNAMLDDSVTDLENACDSKIDNPEDRDRAARAIEIFAQLIEKGAEIYCSIDTPEEIKVQFPFTENAPIIPEGLLQLVEKKENTDNAQPVQGMQPMQNVQGAEVSGTVQSIDTIPVTLSGTVQNAPETRVMQVSGAVQVPPVQAAGTVQNVETATAPPAAPVTSVDSIQPSGTAPNAGVAPSAGEVQDIGNLLNIGGQPSGAVPEAGGVPSADGVQDIGNLLNIGGGQPSGTVPNAGAVPSADEVQDIGNLLNIGGGQPAGAAPDAGDAPSADEVQDVSNLLNVDNMQAEQAPGAVPAESGIQDIGNLLNTENSQTQNDGNASNAGSALEDDSEIIDVMKFI